MGSDRRVGVVLFQLGGPDSREAVEPFLYNLFCDPDIIDFPLARIARQPLARLISRSRAKHAARHYDALGGRSPLIDYTRRQAEALESEMRRTLDARVAIAMRYWHPFTAEAITELERHAPSDVVLLPLYPQYSRTTTGSSINEWNRRFRPGVWNPRVHVVKEYYRDAGYLDALTEGIDAMMRGFEDPREVDVLFSAHNVPASVAAAGDPYPQQVRETMELAWRRGGWPARKHLCYQSKVGTSRWLSPTTTETLELLAAEGRRHVLVVPVSFVSDHVETLYEIDIEYRAHAARLGIADYRMMPGLNNSPCFIAALASLVQRHIMEA